jgi:hypothetical protein
MNRRERSLLIDALLEGEISEADFLRLEAELHVDAGARKEYYERLALSAALESEAVATERKIAPFPQPARWRVPALTRIAAALAVVLGVTALYLKSRPHAEVATVPEEPRASGFAVLASQADAVWKNTVLADGALLPAGPLELVSGLAQVELFSGVTVIIEGEATFEILSPMEMRLTRGKLRAHVPEPAHGFRVHTAEGEVVDLGTEFALAVSATRSEVHVLDGEVEWHPRARAMRRMEKGEAVSWSPEGAGADIAADPGGFVGVAEMGASLAASRRERRAAWEAFSGSLARDPRLVAYYRMGASDSWSRRLANEATVTPDHALDGAIVGAARAADRWGMPDGALDFSPTGSRVRLTVPGDFRSITLLAWVRINSLDRLFNSLFLTDGHDLGEPHWQIMNDGRLFFAVKKREGGGAFSDKRIFHSPVIWTPALSGQWVMLATVYDVEERKVTHYLNGAEISTEAIPDEYLVEKLSIGGASIGNWSEPAYRKGPEFAVRNLNGSIDEFALFSAALTGENIGDIYVHGRP